MLTGIEPFSSQVGTSARYFVGHFVGHVDRPHGWTDLPPSWVTQSMYVTRPPSEDGTCDTGTESPEGGPGLEESRPVITPR